MLLGNFFSIDSEEASGNSLVATLSLNPSHHIFEGHFPGQPVVPGVCMLQMMRELLEKVCNKRLQLKKASHLKFLAIINPNDNPLITAEFSYAMGGEEVIVSGRLFKGDTTFFKFKGVFGG